MSGHAGLARMTRPPKALHPCNSRTDMYRTTSKFMQGRAAEKPTARDVSEWMLEQGDHGQIDWSTPEGVARLEGEFGKACLLAIPGVMAAYRLLSVGRVRTPKH